MGLMDWFKKPVELTPEEKLGVEISRQTAIKQTVMEEESAMTLEEATRLALSITASFEGEGFDQITGNFDDQLLSCGALQWPWKQGTQQKLILRFESLYPGLIQKLMPKSGKKYLQLASMSIASTDATVACWSHGERVFEPYCSELKALWGSNEMISVQVYYAGEIAKVAGNEASKWSGLVRNSRDYTVQEFCFFFDIIVNNGSMNGLSYHDVSERIQSNGLDQAIEEVLHWCATRTRAYQGWKDCVKNAEVWGLALKSSSVNDVSLLILGWLRSLRANHLYQASVMNRRGILALGIGYADGVKRDLASSYSEYWPSTLVS